MIFEVSRCSSKRVQLADQVIEPWLLRAMLLATETSVARSYLLVSEAQLHATVDT